jgi:hypothetical protein
MTTQAANDDDDVDIDGRFQCQLRRISLLEAENASLKEVNDILRKAVAYYRPICAALAERERTASSA